MRIVFGDRHTVLEELGPVRRGRQVHGTTVLRDSATVEEADGQVVTDHEHGALVLTADCVPIALGSDDAVAMLHGGWRGLAAGIVEQGVAMLASGNVFAVIGPSARGCCYEVGEEVHAHFPGHRVGERNLALEAVAAEKLRAAGVSAIEDTGICTICDERYFSYRREGDAAGRNASVVWR